MLSNEDKKARTIVIAKAVNTVKGAYTPFGTEKLFTSTEILQGLQDLECPYYAHVPSVLEKQGFIVKTDEKFNKKTFYYKFTSKEPIDYTHFFGVFDKKPRTVVKAPQQQEEPLSFVLTEEMAVAFLKDLGYRLQKPVTEYKEV